MKPKKKRITFFTDNDVSDAVGEFLRESGHEVIRLREVMLTDTRDPVIAAACREGGLVLVTHNIKHFRRIVREHQEESGQVDRLCRIELACRQFRAAERMRVALSLIEDEWGRLGADKCGLRIVVGDTVIRTHR